MPTRRRHDALVSKSVAAIRIRRRRSVRPEDEAVLRETMERLLVGLDERTRTVFEMRLQGYEIKEIAAALTCTAVTIHRKIRNIKDRLKEICPDLLR